MLFRKYYDSLAGPLLIKADECGICAVCADEKRDSEEILCPLLDEAAAQLDAYFAGRLKRFDLPLSPQGTPFEQAVWAEVRAIPYGEVRTYGQIAAQLGVPGAARAVGRACGANPVLILMPCHRVVGAGGRLTGFAAGLHAKRALLELEGHVLAGDRVMV